MTLNLDRSSWQKLKFGEFAENVNDRVDDPKTAGVSRYVGLEHLDPGNLTVNRWGTPDQVEATKLRFKPGDVIFGRRRAYQKKVARADFEGICSAHAMVLRAKPAVVDPDFLPVFLSSDYFLDRAIKISVGSLSPTVNWKTLAVQEFDLPPLDQQRRIAGLLWLLENNLGAYSDAIRAAQVAKAAYLETQVWSAAHRLVELRTLTHDGQLLDGDWVESKDMSEDGTIRLAQLADIGLGRFLDKSDRWITEQKATELRARILRDGDILISRMADPIGRCCSLPQLPYKVITAVDVAVLRLLPSISVPWVVSVLNSRTWLDSVSRHARGTTRSRISRSDLEGILIPDPHAPTVTDQERMIRSFDDAIDKSSTLLDETRLLKSTLFDLLWRRA